MKISYNWLQDYIQELPNPNDLAELLSAHFAEVEKIEKVGADFYLDIDVKPNRASDAFSHIGIARECAAILERELKLPQSELGEKEAGESKGPISIEVQDKNACLRYSAQAMKGVKVGPSPDWLKQRLQTCGLKSINNIVDIANYVMLETGQPLHIFDADKLEGKKLIVRFAKEGESLKTLDNEKFELNPDVLVIADEKEPVAIAGIKGGSKPGVKEATTAIILESANFEPITIRKASQFLRLRTDASWRFEHGLDPNMTEPAINRALFLIRKIAGGEKEGSLIDICSLKTKPGLVILELDKIKRVLGIKIRKEKVVSILERLGFKIIKDEENKIHVRVPTFRTDVSLPEDLIEEIGRIYGYEKIPAVMPKTVLALPQTNLNIFWEETAKDAFKESGFTEVFNYSFISQKQAEFFGFSLDSLIELENPLSQNYQFLSPSLICNLIENTKLNLKKFSKFKIFEIGKTFSNKKGIEEKRRLTGLIVDKNGGETMFFEAKGALDNFFSEIGITDQWYDNFEPTPEKTAEKIWQKQGSAEVKIRDKEIGFIGFVNKDLLKREKVDAMIVAFDIDFEKVQQFASAENEYELISPYPEATRDLALLVPVGTKVIEVLNVINRAGGELVRDVDLFDIYYPAEQESENQKSFAFHIIYQAKDRTLSNEEINNLQKRITEALEEKGWEVRK